MIKGEEGVQWTKTNLFEHLCEKFPVGGPCTFANSDVRGVY